MPTKESSRSEFDDQSGAWTSLPKLTKGSVHPERIRLQNVVGPFDRPMANGISEVGWIVAIGLGWPAQTLPICSRGVSPLGLRALGERGGKASHNAVWPFLRREGLRFKNALSDFSQSTE